MFDQGTSILLFAFVVGATVIGLTADQLEPRGELATAVDIAQLPSAAMAAPAGGAPAQHRVSPIEVALGDGFTAKLKYSYVIEGLVVTHREFRHDLTSPISPLDVGIVWGELAEPGGIDGFKFRAGNRRLKATPPPGADLRAKWFEQVTNNHMVPANQAVLDKLMALEVGSHVKIRGYLVDVTVDHIKRWRSSTRRDDRSVGRGCEIILVTEVTPNPSGAQAAAQGAAKGPANPT